MNLQVVRGTERFPQVHLGQGLLVCKGQIEVIQGHIDPLVAPALEQGLQLLAQRGLPGSLGGAHAQHQGLPALCLLVLQQLRLKPKVDWQVEVKDALPACNGSGLNVLLAALNGEGCGSWRVSCEHEEDCGVPLDLRQAGNPAKTKRSPLTSIQSINAGQAEIANQLLSQVTPILQFVVHVI